MMIGTTISFAGNPRIKASSMTPSIPMTWANGSRNPEQCARSVASPTEILAISQMMSPAGAATTIARPRTNRVLAKIERTITFPICGFRYGGSSSVKAVSYTHLDVYKRQYSRFSTGAPVMIMPSNFLFLISSK